MHTVDAVTIDSTETITSDRSAVVSSSGMIAWFDGNVCPTEVVGSLVPGMTYCPTATNSYDEIVNVDGVCQGCTSVACPGTNSLITDCGHIIDKTTTYSCTYTTSVTTWGACNASGIQYATGYAYDTVPGQNCVDKAPTSRACVPEKALIASCPYVSTPESPVLDINGGLSRDKDPNIRTLFRDASITENINLPAGEYMVETINYDGYAGRGIDGHVQPNEQWNIKFISGGTVLTTVGPTTDVADGVDEDTKTDTFGPITLGGNVDTIQIVHVPKNLGNSVVPVCIKFTKQDVAVPEPTLTFNPNPGTIDSGDSSTLTWTPTNADTCTASGGWSGSKSSTGGTEVVTPSVDTQYYLECWNSEGDSTGKRLATVFVLGAPTASACTLSIPVGSFMCTGDDAGPGAWTEVGTTLGDCGSNMCEYYTPVAATPLKVEISADPDGNVTLGNEIRWTATASGGTPPYQSFVWSGEVSGSGTDYTATTNYIDGRISETGNAKVYVTVTDSASATASDDYTSTIIDNRRPQ